MTVLRRSLAGAAAALAVLLLGAQLSRDEAPPRSQEHEVVARLAPADGRAYSEGLRAALRAWRADPNNRAAVIAAAGALIDEGRATGNARLVAAASGLLRPFLDADDPEVLRLAAIGRQYQHDFAGAVALLDRALALAPRDPDLLMNRATIRVVQGRPDLADGDCRRLYTARRADLAILCQATARMLSAGPEVYGRLTWLVRTGSFEPALSTYALSLMGEIAALNGREDAAREHLEAVLAARPSDIRARLLLADVLLAEGDEAAALEALAAAPDVDAVLLRRAIAAERLDRPELGDPARDELARRFRQNLDLGLTAHAREEARFFLAVDPRPKLALERAQANWALQREIEDAQLFIDAAVAAGEPAAAAPVVRWLDAYDVEVPAVRIPEPLREAAR